MAQTREVRGVATKVLHHGGGVSCYYHDTCIATRTDGGRVTLNSDGWKTNTTKLRMNQFASQYCQNAYSVWQHKGEWYVTIGENCLKFKDGMEFEIGS